MDIPQKIKNKLPYEPAILSSVQFSHSVVSDSATPWTTACQVSLSVTIFWSLLKLMSIELVMPSNHLILCQPLLRGSTKNIGCSQGESRAEPDLRREKEKKKKDYQIFQDRK